MTRTRRTVLASVAIGCLVCAGNACIAVIAPEAAVGTQPRARAVVTGVRVASATNPRREAPPTPQARERSAGPELLVAGSEGPFLRGDARLAGQLPRDWPARMPGANRGNGASNRADERPEVNLGAAQTGPARWQSPAVELMRVELPREDFVDTGPGTMQAGLSGLDVDALRSVAGARMQLVAAEDERGRVLAETRLSWLFEYLQTPAGAAAFFAPGERGIFAVQGLNYGSNWLLLGWGVRFELVGGLSAYTHYDAQANAAQLFHIGSGGFAYTW